MLHVLPPMVVSLLPVVVLAFVAVTVVKVMACRCVVIGCGSMVQS